MGDKLTLLVIVLQFLAGAAYGLEAAWGKVLYFAGATILTIGVLLMKG